ncbi:MAG: ABC transporter permease [Dehalococcoidia bacterium]|nr:ABC transporter permease [Dehalococcoidia bacterium]
MNLSRIAALAMRIALQFRRDKRTIALIVGVPIVVLSLLTYLINLGASSLVVGVAQEDPSPVASKLVEELRKVPIVKVREVSRQDVDGLFRKGEIEAAIVIPQGFTQRLLAREAAALETRVEGSRHGKAPMLMHGLNQSIARMAAAGSGAGAVEPEVTYLYAGPEYKPIDYFAPTYVALFAFLFVYLLTAVGFLRERTLGTFERLLASPLTKVEMVLGYMAGFGMFALLQSTIILLFTVYVIRIHYAGNIFIVFLIVSIMTVGAVNLGIFLSTYARNELQAVQFIPMVVVPQALLGGIFWPLKEMNVFFQVIAHVLPLTYANFALQAVMIKGQGILDPGVAADIGALVLFAAIVVALA